MKNWKRLATIFILTISSFMPIMAMVLIGGNNPTNHWVIISLVLLVLMVLMNWFENLVNKYLILSVGILTIISSCLALISYLSDKLILKTLISIIGLCLMFILLKFMYKNNKAQILQWFLLIASVLLIVFDFCYN